MSKKELFKLLQAARSGDLEAVKKVKEMAEQGLLDEAISDSSEPSPSKPKKKAQPSPAPTADQEAKLIQSFTKFLSQEDVDGKGSKKLAAVLNEFREMGIPENKAHKRVLDYVTLKPEEWPQEDSRNWGWQLSHLLIKSSMNNLLIDKQRMPSVAEIAKDTGLSRMTVNTHLKEMRVHPMFEQELTKYEVLQLKILDTLYLEAITGNIKAARLFLEAVNNSKVSVRNQTNNFLTINNLTITPADVEKLPEEKRRQLESLFKKTDQNGINSVKKP